MRQLENRYEIASYLAMTVGARLANKGALFIARNEAISANPGSVSACIFQPKTRLRRTLNSATQSPFRGLGQNRINNYK
jgi:hypothetical protein